MTQIKEETERKEFVIPSHRGQDPIKKHHGFYNILRRNSYLSQWFKTKNYKILDTETRDVIIKQYKLFD